VHLKEYLNIQALSSLEFAKLAGVSYRTIYRILHGAPCRMRVARQIEKATEGKVKKEELM